MVPATCVPCPPSSVPTGSTQLATSHGPSTSGMSGAKLRDSAQLKFGARSGWLASTPVSSTPTVTRRSPGSILRASSARIMSRPQSLSSSGSIFLALPLATLPLVAAAASRFSCSTRSSFGLRPIAFSSAAPTRAPAAVARLAKSARSLLTWKRPTSSVRATTVPPAAVIAAIAASVDTPLSASTVKVRVSDGAAFAGIPRPVTVSASEAAAATAPTVKRLLTTSDPLVEGRGVIPHHGSGFRQIDVRYRLQLGIRARHGDEPLAVRPTWTPRRPVRGPEAGEVRPG